MSRNDHLNPRNTEIVRLASTMTVAEIAEATGVSASAARQVLYRSGVKAVKQQRPANLEPLALRRKHREREARIISNGKMAAALLREKAIAQSSQSGA